MRIVSGRLKGRRFSPPGSFKARPTTDQARENLFNILANKIDFEEQRVLDLFSGTGAMSYEFASRGSKDITCVEKNHAHFTFIKKTASALEISSGFHVVKGDVFKFITRDTNHYTLVFADPPFDLPRLSNLPDMVMKAGILAPGGLFILEHGPDQNFENFPFFVETRRYGKVNFSFFE
ncbi:MAG: RsmD family RNA methyltransferase [Marinilabilia sp.]